MCREARNEIAGEFVKRMEKVQEEMESALKRVAKTIQGSTIALEDSCTSIRLEIR